MSRRVFEDGAMVLVGGVGSPRKVKDGVMDCDGEIKVWNYDESDWFYYAADICELADEPKTGNCAAHSNQAIKSEGTVAMANTSRSIVKVVLIDEDAGLDPSKALVKDFGEHVLEGSQEDLKMQIVMSNNIESVLRAHNEMRAKETDLDIRQRTGNEVKLQPRKLHELTWKIGVVA